MQRTNTDEELLAAFQQSKDNRLLGILLQRYTLLLLGVCMKYLKNETDAQDCVQQVFLKAVAYLPEHSVINFGSWIYTVTKNQCFMRLRSLKSTPENTVISEILEAQPENLYDNNREETLTALENAIRDLPHGQKECIKMFYLDKLSYNDIVNGSDFSLLQVKSYIQNGKRNLKLLLEKHLKSNSNG